MCTKKINVSSWESQWEHEVWARKKIPSATISHYNVSPKLNYKSHIFDTKSSVNTKSLSRNIRFIAESIAKYVYPNLNVSSSLQTFGDFEVSSGYLKSTDIQFVDSYMDLLTTSTRSTAFVQSNSPSLLNALQNGLNEILHDVSNSSFSLNTNYEPVEGLESETITFYECIGSTPGSNSIKTSLFIYRIKSSTFDVVISLIIAVYLVLLYVIFKGPLETIDQIKKSFFKKEKKIAQKKKQS